MADMMLDFMIGPFRNLTDMYMAHAWLCNIVVLCTYFFGRMLRKNRSVTNK